VTISLFLWRAAEWQNSIRTAMKMEPVETAHPLKLTGIALIKFWRCSGWLNRSSWQPASLQPDAAVHSEEDCDRHRPSPFTSRIWCSITISMRRLR
jgi:hypothetical protein